MIYILGQEREGMAMHDVLLVWELLGEQPGALPPKNPKGPDDAHESTPRSHLRADTVEKRAQPPYTQEPMPHVAT